MNTFQLAQISGWIFYLVLFCWLFYFIKRTMYFAYLWQLKEYRWDRMRDFIGTYQGRKSFINLSGAVTLAFLLLIFFLADFAWAWLTLVIGAAGWYLTQLIFLLKDLGQRKLKSPKFTSKAMVLTAGVFIFEIAVILWWYLALQTLRATVPFLIEDLFFIMAMELLAPLWVALITILLWPVTNYLKNRILKQARAKLSRLNTTVIGITGSYGKTSTKEFLAAILGAKFKVLKTPEHVNTELGVANIILTELTPEHEIFIVEMGAYRTGEIKTLCRLTNPKIGVLTGINEQHLSLFGSLDNIITAKSELISSLPVNGLAVVNGDSPAAQQAAAKRATGGRVEFYSLNEKGAIKAHDIIIELRTIKFTVETKRGSFKVTAPLLGKQQASNLLAAITVAEDLGMSPEEISQALVYIKPLSRAMSPKEGPKQTLLIDDTYNANPNGVKAGLEYLAATPFKTKILVLDDLNELGHQALAIHEELAKLAARSAQVFVLVGYDYAENFKQSLMNNGADKERIIVTRQLTLINDIIKEYLNAETVILFSGRGAGKVLNNLISTGAED